LKVVTVLFLILVPHLAGAVDYTIGGGLTTGNQTLSASGSPDSKFSANGYVLEGGLNFQNGKISIEQGVSQSKNSLSSQTYMETGQLEYRAVKAGIKFGSIGLGGGYRFNEIDLKSLSLQSPNYLESKYTGWTPLGYLNFNIYGLKKLFTTIEAQYVSGKLKPESSQLSEVQFSEMSLSLRIFIQID